MLDAKIVPMDEEMGVEISRDKMLCEVSFMPETNGGSKLSLEKIREIISSNGVVAGLDNDMIENISKQRQYNHKYIIARGVQQIDGEDARVELMFDSKELNEFKPTVKEDGTVDFRDLNTVKNVKAGDILAIKIPPKQGIDGYNVTGQDVKARKPKEVRIPRGKNTKMLDDNITLVACIDGKLEYDDHNVYINSVYTLNNDVDNSIGNIDFIGDVIINGNVNSGFTIKAGGNVEVRGSVEDSVIEAGGNVIVTYGMQGTSRSRIIAKGNVMTKFLQNVEVEAGGSIITEAILHSNVIAGNSIKSDTGKGTIVGGNVAAANIIEANSIGSTMGTITRIQLGIPAIVYREYKELGEKVKILKGNIIKIDQGIRFLMEKQRGEKLDSNKKYMLEKFLKSRQPLHDEYEELVHKHNLVGIKLNNVKDGMVKVSNIIYPGVKIEIGSLSKYIDDPYRRCIIRKSEGDIVIN